MRRQDASDISEWLTAAMVRKKPVGRNRSRMLGYGD
jgi:hypothetical protein